ncbi:DUF448 domain-containing protein [Fusobacterium russii]|uniref:DUF448 domain-containing protein n=1 Tax=Fusobacterium russii TaxID=854 RepID=UPI0003A197AD|nr:DUF448 domain-containing protein [Fusobacterium russii]
MSEDKHIPERSCLICRAKKNKINLFRLAKLNKESYVYDKDYKIQARGTYVCKSLNCLGKLSKHKKVKVESNDLLKMLNFINKTEKNYVNILKSMKNSGELVFGINLFFENIEHIHCIVMAEDIAEKNRGKIIDRAKEFRIPYLFAGNKKSLGEIFDKEEVNVIAIKDKKMAKGLI